MSLPDSHRTTNIVRVSDVPMNSGDCKTLNARVHDENPHHTTVCLKFYKCDDSNRMFTLHLSRRLSNAIVPNFS